MWFHKGNNHRVTWVKKISIILVIMFIAMQFVQPSRNKQGGTSARADMTDNVKEILIRSCFDCHSNNTSYPWYSSIQPVGWILEYHIKEGRADLNFDEFKGYSKRRQLNKLRSIRTSIKEGSMPIPSYLMIHHDAKLSAKEKTLITEWAQRTEDSIAQKKT
jgi:hypothetical protein